MAHTSLITPAASGGHGSVRPARPHVARRRRLLVALLVAFVVGLAIVINYGPMTAYQSARTRLDAATAQVGQLEQQKEQLQTELGKLGEAGYLESLARQQLTYAKPGEEIYIIPAGGGDTDQHAESQIAESGQERGFLERLLSSLSDLF